jgi:hypothetical protein
MPRGGVIMNNHQDQPHKSREIIYQVGRKKGKIVLNGQSDKLTEESAQQLQHSLVSRVLFQQVKAPNAKAVAVIQTILPIVIFALTVTLLIILVQI